jgi:hypothetical protein
VLSVLAAQAAASQPSQILPQQVALLETLFTSKIYCPVALCIIGGLLMSFGFKAYKWIVVLNLMALGFVLGHMLGERSQISMIGGAIGAALATVIALPLMRYAVAVCGGLVGAVIGMVVWAYCEQPINMAWAGGLVGLAVLGMLTFIWFKTTVILFTSIEGAAMFVLRTSAILMHYEPWSKEVANSSILVRCCCRCW